MVAAWRVCPNDCNSKAEEYKSAAWGITPKHWQVWNREPLVMISNVLCLIGAEASVRLP
jgi:hypothetical protein